MRHPSTRLPTALSAVLSLALSAAALAQGNGRRDILDNGGFEDGTKNWEPDQGQTVVADERQAHSGKACLFGEVTQPNKHWQLTRKVKVSARNIYEFEAWTRATNNTKIVLWAVMPGAKQRTMVTTWERIPAKWKRVTTAITVPQDGMLELHIIMPSSHGAPAGKMWLDDVALYETVMPSSVSAAGNDGFNDEPTLAAAGDGSVYVAWNRFRDGVGDSLRAARYSVGTDGALASEAEWEVVPPGPKTYLLHPYLVGTDDGAFLLYSTEVNENDWEVMAVPLSPGGPGKATVVSRSPGIDVKPTGVWTGTKLAVAWESNPAGRRVVRVAEIANGTAGAAETISAADCSNYAPSITALPNGELAVAWHSFRQHNYDIYLTRRPSDGTWATATRLTTTPTVDRHPRLFARAGELWVAYENATSGGYRIGATAQRHLVVGKIDKTDKLTVPGGPVKSPLGGRCEAATPIADSAGRVWVAHLRPRGRREGWDTFVAGHNGAAWTPLQRVSSSLGMDRRPGAAIAGDFLVVASQTQGKLLKYNDIEQTAGACSDVGLFALDLRKANPATTMELEPFAEEETEYEPGQLRQNFGDNTDDVPTITYEGQTLKLVYGDLHEHTDVSQCNRLGDQSIDESYQHMRDIARLDFAAATDHGYNITPYLWNYTAKLARINYDPGRFITFLGEEWTSTFEKYSDKHPYGYYGHRNLIFADAYMPRWWNAQDEQTPADVWADLRKMNANFVQIPHQIADTGNVPTDWDFTDEAAQPVAEINQVRGSYEYKGAPREANRSTPAGWFMQDAWARGIVIGVIASPDHGGGIGKACVYATDMTREAILDGMRARHCFGTTAARIVLDVRVNGHLMGEKIPAPNGQPVTVDVNVTCPGDIDRIEVCRSNTFIYSKQPAGRAASFTFTDAEPIEGKSYYYVRVIQKDTEIAWSSPVWLGY